jgi:triphosphatase
MQPVKWRRPRIACAASASEAFLTLYAAVLAQIAANRQGAALGRDPEYLHQLRVGARRLRSILRAFRPILRRSKAKALARRIKTATHALGRARDWDVFCEALPDLGADEPMRARAARKRANAQRKSRAGIRSLPVAHNARALLAGRDEPLAQFAGRSLQRLHSRLLRSAASIDWEKPRQRHPVRIAVKRVRYALDAFAPCFPGAAARAYADDMKKVQDLLGGLNDAAVGLGLLKKLGGSAEVERRLAARERGLMAGLLPAWTAFRARPVFWRAP